MAKQHSKPYPGNWEYHTREDWNAYSERVDKLFSNIPRDRIVSFPVGDGNALYYLFSEQPLVLQHIPYGDAYRVDPALIRGLRLTDIKRRVALDSQTIAWQPKRACDDHA